MKKSLEGAQDFEKKKKKTDFKEYAALSENN